MRKGDSYYGLARRLALITGRLFAASSPILNGLEERDI